MIRKIFYVIGIIGSLWSVSALYAQAHENRNCDELCQKYREAKSRHPHPTKKPLVCVNFYNTKPGLRVTIRTSIGDQEAILDGKVIPARNGQFCYPRDRWYKYGEPDKVILCSEHSVILHESQIAPILSGRGTVPEKYACLLGIAACGGRENVSIPAYQLQ